MNRASEHRRHRRKPGRFIRWALILVLALAGAGAAFRLLLPGIIEREVARRLADAGYEEPRLRVASAGLHQLEVLDLGLGKSSWQINLRQGTLHYWPWKLFRPEVRLAHLDGLRLSVDLAAAASSPGAISSETTDRPERAHEALSQVPVRLLVITNSLVQLHGAGDDLQLSFDLRLTNFVSPRQVGAQANLTLEQGTWAGLNLRHAKLDAEAAISVEVTAMSPKPELAFDWIAARVPWARPWLQDLDFGIQMTAESLGMEGDAIISDPVLRLDRSASPGPSRAPQVNFSAEATTIRWGGVPVSGLRAAGEIAGDEMRINGTARLGQESFAYQLEAAPSALASNGPEFTGRFSLGPIRLDKFQPPRRWTEGQTIQISGELGVSGRLGWGPNTRLSVWPDLALSLERIEWLENGLFLEGIQGALSGAIPGAAAASATNVLRIDRVRWGEHAASALEIRIARVDDAEYELELLDAQVLGGRVRVPAFRWKPGMERLSAVLELEQVSLAALAELLPRFDGTIEGGLSGRLPLRMDTSGLSLGTTTLRLDRSRPAWLRYPAKGLLTRRATPGSERHRQLRLVETALENLRLTELSIELQSPEQRQTPVRLRLEGTFSSDTAVIPVKFNLNVNGELDPVWRILTRGDIELDF